MRRHIASVSETQIGKLIEGNLNYLVFGFKKRESFFENINPGDVVFLRGEDGLISGSFVIKKIDILIGPEKEDFNEKGFENEKIKALITVYIKNLEQLITSPIEIDKRSRKDWVVLE